MNWRYRYRPEVGAKLEEVMTGVFKALLDMSLKRKVSMHKAAYMVAVSRVAEAMKLRAGSKNNSKGT